MAYQIERQLKELGDRGDRQNEKARAEQMINEVREFVRTQSTDLAKLRQLTSDLQQIGYGLASATQQAGTEQTGKDGPDDVIDADFRKTG